MGDICREQKRDFNVRLKMASDAWRKCPDKSVRYYANEYKVSYATLTTYISSKIRI